MDAGARLASDGGARPLGPVLAGASKLAAMLEQAERLAGFGLWELDVATGVVTWSAGTFRVHDLEPGSSVPLEDAIDFYIPEHREHVRASVEACAVRGEPLRFEASLVTASGRAIWVRSYGDAERDERGEIVRICGAVRDITAQREAEAALRREKERRELLYQEMEHRTRNSLAGLAALVTRLEEGDGGVGEMAERLRRRIVSIAEVHSMLTSSGFEPVAFERIVEAAAGQAGGDEVGGEGGVVGGVVASGPGGVLVPARQVPAAMTVLSELVNNSQKHGALAGGGRLEIGWRVAGGGDGAGVLLEVRVADRGGPRVAGPPGARGLGLELVEGMVGSELAGTVEMSFEPGGVEHRLALRLDPV